jgi:hypothetical protein
VRRFAFAAVRVSLNLAFAFWLWVMRTFGRSLGMSKTRAFEAIVLFDSRILRFEVIDE